MSVNSWTSGDRVESKSQRSRKRIGSRWQQSRDREDSWDRRKKTEGLERRRQLVKRLSSKEKRLPSQEKLLGQKRSYC